MSTKTSKLLSFVKKYPIFKKIYFFYNIYIRNYKFIFKSSQFGEDVIVHQIFDKDYKGTYLDLGCFHPTRSNNTFRLYKEGWYGINIDLNPLTIDLFKFARPKDINVCAAISNKEETKNLYFLGDLDSKNTLSINHKKWLNKHFKINDKDFKVTKIKTKKLSSILKKHNFYKIDFMNIDIEGHELEVLKSLDFSKYEIQVICVEILDYDKFAKKRKKDLISYLKSKGYVLFNKSTINYVFKKRNFYSIN